MPVSDSLGEAFVEIRGRLSRLAGDLSDAESLVNKRVGEIGQRTRRLGQNLTLGVTAPILALTGAVATIGTNLNEAMANVASLIPDNAQRIAELKTEVQGLAVETGKATTDIADGLYEVVSAFGDGSETAAILRTNARAAAAGLAETTDAIRLTSAVTKGYGDTSAAAVQQASDLAFTTVRLGQTNFPELAAAIGRVVPLTSELRVSQEELFGVMATGTGVTGTASEVSTQLRGILQSLMVPTEGMAMLLDELGVSSGRALIEQRGLQGALTAIVGAAEASGAPLQNYIGSIEGQTLALALGGAQADTFTQKLAAMQNVSGATDQAFRAQTEGVNAAGFAWKQFQQEAVVAMQQLSDVLLPVLMDAAQSLRPVWDLLLRLIGSFREMPQPVQTAVVVLGAVAAAAGPVLVVVGSMISALTAIAPLFAAGGTAAAVLGGALTILTGPIGLVVAAVAGLIAAWMAWGDDITAVVSSTVGAVVDWLGPKLMVVWEPISGLLTSIGQMFGAFRDLVGAVFMKVVEITAGAVAEVIVWLVERLQPVFGPIGTAIRVVQTVFEVVSNASIAAARALYEGVKIWLVDRFTAVIDRIKGAVDSVTGFFEDMYEKVVGGSFVPDMVAGIEAEFGKLSAVMVNPTQAAVSGVEGLFSGLASSVDGIFSNLFSGLMGKVQGFFGSSGIGGVISDGIGSIVSNVQGRLGGMLSGLFGGGGGAAGGAGGLLGGAGGMAGLGATLATSAATMGIGLAVQGIGAFISSRQNDTKKTRDQFAQQFGGDQALWDQLNQAGRGDLVHQALNVIGRKDTEANQIWMQNVVAALEAAKTKATETGDTFASIPEKSKRAAEDTSAAFEQTQTRIADLEASLTETLAMEASARTEDERDAVRIRAEVYQEELEKLRASVVEGGTAVADALATEVKTQAGHLKTAVREMSTDVDDAASTAASDVRASFRDLFGQDGLKMQVETVLREVRSLSGSIRDELGDLSFDIPVGFSVEPGRGGIRAGSEEMKIEWAARGGIALGPTIVGVGEAGPEALIPLDRLEAMMGASPGGSGGHTVIFENGAIQALDGHSLSQMAPDIANAVIRAIELNDSGGSPVSLQTRIRHVAGGG